MTAEEKDFLCGFLLIKIDVSSTNTFPISGVRQLVRDYVQLKGRHDVDKIWTASGGLPSLHWTNDFLRSYKSQLQRCSSGVQRTSQRRLNASSIHTQANHFNVINILNKECKIVGCSSTDETSAGDNNIKDIMENRALNEFITIKGQKANIPQSQFQGHFSGLFTVGVKLNSDNQFKAMDKFPVLCVQSGSEDKEGETSLFTPEDTDTIFPNSFHTVNESGSVNKKLFQKTLLEILLPHIKKEFPNLKYGGDMFMMTYDCPSIHNVDDTTLMTLREAGIILVGLPKNSTHWSQPCDHRYVFGALKKQYYKLLDEFLRNRREREAHLRADQQSSATIRGDVILPLLTQAWEQVTPRRIVGAFRETGLLPGNTPEIIRVRTEAQNAIMSRAPDAHTKLKVEEPTTPTPTMTFRPSQL